MINRSFVGILLVLMLALTGNPCIASATDIYKTNTSALSIPDDGSLVYSNINISDASIPTNAVVTGIDVNFISNHQRSQDLEVYVQYSSLGWTTILKNYNLWNHEGGTAPNPTKTATGVTMFNGLGVKGNWSLYVKDIAPGATGNITSWWIRVYYTSASGPGSTTVSCNASFLNNLTSGHDENNDGYMEDYQLLVALDIAAPVGVKVWPKIIYKTGNATRKEWISQTGAYNNDRQLQVWDQAVFFNYITQNSTLNFTVELWDDNTFENKLLASTTVTGTPIKVGVGYFPSGYIGDWFPGSDIDADGYYDTYQFKLVVADATYAGPAEVIEKIICTTTGQTWWDSAPRTISNVYDYHYFNFSEADFASYISDNTTLNFLVELWNPTKTTKLGSTTYYGKIYSYGINVDGSAPCLVTVNNFTASSPLIDPYNGGYSNFTADISATHSNTWQLNINGEDVASGDTSSVSQPWYGKNLFGQILVPGTYTATLTATDPIGQCSDSKTVTINLTKKADSPSDCMLKVNTGSTTSVATGDVDHSQTLFSLKGTALSTNIELFYNSLNPYNGPLGPGWSHTYDISATENSDGSILLREGTGGKSLYTKSITENPDGSILIKYIPPAGDFSTLVKNGDGTYVITYRDGHKYNIRADGKIASIVDHFENAISFAYPNGDLHTVTDPAQRVTIFDYDTTVTPHRIKTITDPNLKVYDFSYQGNALWKVINPPADPAIPEIRGYWEYIYDQGFLTSKRDPQNNLTQYTYYPDHRLQSTIDPEGVTNPINHTRTIVYPTTSTNLKTTTVTEKDGGQWLYTYDAQAGVLKQKTAHNTTTNDIVSSYTYYPSGYIKSKTEPKDGTVYLTTFYAYDSYGNILTQTDPVNLASYDPPIVPENVIDPSTLAIMPAFRYAYDYANYDQIQSISNERSAPFATTTYLYSTLNGYKVTTVTDPDSHVTTYRYNTNNGTLKDITDANNNVVSFDYNPNGLLKTFTDLNGVITTFSSYDTNGNNLELKIKDTNNKELTTSFAVDSLNRLTKITKFTADFPDNVTKFAYDLNGNRTSVIDAETKETKYEYRYDGQVNKITDAKLKDTIFTYGPTGCPSCGGGMDKLSVIKDAKLHETKYFYDQLGRLEHETDPLNKSIRYTYYDNGKVKDKIDSSSVPEKTLITYTYDNLGRLTNKHYYDSSNETYTYDLKGNLETAVNQNIGYTFVYYDNGWLKSVTDSTGKIISYDLYDGIGQREQVTILKESTDQRQINYDYDTSNRPDTITSPAGVFKFEYDYSGRRKLLTYPNQTTIAHYGYDDLDRLNSLTHSISGGSTFLDYGYTHYPVGNRKTRTGTSPQTYNYDEVYRLLQAVTTKGTENYTYDDVGNRKTGPGFKDTGYAYNDANQVTTGRRLQYTYDDYGNQKARIIPNAPEKSWSQGWDYENRLSTSEMIKGSEHKTITYKYDPLGRRIKKIISTFINDVTKTSTYEYVYDNEDIVQETLTIGTATTKTFFTHGPGIDEPLAMMRTENGVTNTYYYHADGLGSITAITNTAKEVVQSYDYESFGLVKPSKDFANSYTFTGREWDKETGLMNYRGRTYDMREGRFISKDPISFAGGDVNLYSYVAGNSTNMIDPWGLWSFTAEAYLKFGGGFIVGRNDDGSAFLTVRAGAGVGGGAKYDPRGQSPGYSADKVEEILSAALNLFAETDASFGPASCSIGTKAGLHAKDKKRAYGFWEQPGWPNVSVSTIPSQSLHLGAAAGLEGTLILKPLK